MEGPIKEGIYKDADNNWFKVEFYRYPRKRFVIRPARLVSGGGHEVVGTDMPPITPEQWACLKDWL